MDENDMTREEFSMVWGLRKRGYAVVVFSPGELGAADPGLLEDAMVIRGFDFIDNANKQGAA